MSSTSRAGSGSGEAPRRALFGHAPAHAVALLDTVGVVTEVNEAAAGLLGVVPADAPGQHPEWLFAMLGLPGAAEALDRARGGETVTGGAWTEPAEGPPRWCESRLSALRDDREALRGFAVIVQDATEARRRELSHPESESRFAQALARAPVHVFNQDLELRYVWVPTAMPGLGVPPGTEAIGRGDDDLLPADAASALTAVKRRVIEQDAGERAELELRSAEGEFVFDLTVEPLHDARGAVVGITCAAIDVTARRAVEDELRRSRALLAQAEHLARMGSYEWDIDEDRMLWSDGLYEIHGLAPGAEAPCYATRGERVHPDDRERVDAAVGAALEAFGEIDIEYRIVRPDGRVRRVHGRSEVLVDHRGRAVRMAGTVQDVTELRAAEEALERTAAELGRRAVELHRVTRRPTGAASEADALLTPRQLEILGLIADGLGNAEIASRLFLSETTIKWHVRQILRKLRVANRAEAVARYVRSSGSEA